MEAPIGLSSSKSKTTTNQTQTGNQVTNATTTPTAPDWVTGIAQDYADRIGAFGEMDPNQFVAAASPLQQMAWQNAGTALNGWQGQMAAASQAAQAAGQRGANTAAPAQQYNPATGSAQSYRAPTIESIAYPQALAADDLRIQPSWQASALGYDSPQLAQAATVNGTGYQPATLGQASLVSGRGYDAPKLGAPQTYAAARVGSPIGTNTSQASAAQLGPAAQVGAVGYTPYQLNTTTIAKTPGATATDAKAQSLLDNLSAYQNPYQQQVIDASLAEFDNSAAQQQARLAANGAKAGAFGGSRFGLAEGQLAADTVRGRSSLKAGLLDEGFRSATDLSQTDAAARQQAELFNAQNRTGTDQFNAGLAANYALNQANLDQTSTLAATDALNQSYRYTSDAINRERELNQQATNNFAQQNAGFQQQANLFNAGALNDNARFDAGRADQYALTQAGLDTDAARYGADIGNQFAQTGAGLEAAARQFTAGQGQQADLANQNTLSQYALAQAGLTTDANRYAADAANRAGEFNATALNDRNSQQAGLDAAARQFNTGAANQIGLANQDAGNQFAMAQFNAMQDRAQQYAAAQNQMGLAGYQGALQQALEQARMQENAGQFDANANNQFSLANMAAMNDAGQFNTGQSNDMARFNAGQQDVAANRGLQSAQLLGGLASDYGNGTRSDLSLMAQLGDQQRQIEQSYAMAPLAQLQMMGQLGQIPLSAFIGQNVSGTQNTTGTLNGTQVTKQSPSLFDSILGGASLFI